MQDCVLFQRHTTLSYHQRARRVRPLPPGSLTSSSQPKRSSEGSQVQKVRRGNCRGARSVMVQFREGAVACQMAPRGKERWTQEIPRKLATPDSASFRGCWKERQIAGTVAGDRAPLCCARRAFNLSALSIQQKTSLCIGHVGDLTLARWPISYRPPGPCGPGSASVSWHRL